ncbi:MAG: hypothetical protein PVI81_05740 [Anaerolineales bacterium]|jgi:hypothetical protein
MKKYGLLILVLALSLTAVIPAFASGNPHTEAVVYVRSQGLYYDSIVLTDLPQKGRFQKLEMVEGQLETDFGPGDPGYLGGRWWMDVNGNDVQDAGDHYFLCPLLGPGFEIE